MNHRSEADLWGGSNSKESIPGLQKYVKEYLKTSAKGDHVACL